MKLRLILALLVCAVPAIAQTPACRNVKDNSEPFNIVTAATNSIAMELPEPSGANNAIIVPISHTGGTLSVVDDKSNTYVLGHHTNDSGNGEDVSIYYAIGTTGGVRKVTVSTTSTSDNFFAAAVIECTNVATSSALDVHNGNSANTNTIQAGSVTPSVSNDLFIQVFWNDFTISSAQTNILAGSQSNITWKLFVADRAAQWGAQWGVYTTTTAINPQMTDTGNTGYVTAMIGLKQAAAGTAFPTSGTHILSAKTMWLDQGQRAWEGTMPRTEQLPCDPTANAVYFGWVGNQNLTLTGITDSNSNTYTATGAANCSSTGCVHAFRTGDGTGVTLTNSQTLVYSGTNPQSSASGIVYCVSNLGTFDKTATGTGTQSTNGASVTGTSITPATSNGIIFSVMQESTSSFSGVSAPAAGQFDSCFWGNQPGGGGGCDQDNGWAHYFNPNTSAVSFTWTNAFAGKPVGIWADRNDAFKAPAGAACGPRMMVGYGC
jgi:hypothetical protein